MPVDARSLLDAGPFSVVHKTTTPPSGDKHDYMSVGPYWWPDPASANGLPYVRRDGEVNPDFSSSMYDHAEMDRFAAAVRDLTLAWVTTRDRAYARKAASLVRAWFLDPATRMNANLQFGQAVPGHCAGRGIGLIDTKSFVQILDCTLILRQAGDISPDDIGGLQRWFSDFLDWMLTHQFGKTERREHNNHGTWCDVQLAAYALFVGRPALAREVISEVPEQRIIPHIAPDGSQEHELARTRAFSYSCFNLQGLFALAWLGRHVGVDLWSFRSEDGRSLRKALDWLAPYADPARSWPYAQISKEGVADNPSLGSSARAPLVPLLRQAAIAYQEPAYLAAALAMPQAASDFASAILWPVDVALARE